MGSAAKKKAPDLGVLATLAQQVASEHDEFSSAVSLERDAEAAVLARMISLARKALPAISNVITKTEDPQGDTLFQDRGVKIAHAPDGDLYLLATGELAVVENKLEWPMVENTMNKLTTREAMDVFSLDEALTTLQGLLEAQLGKRKQRSQEAVKRATTLIDTLASLPKPDDDPPF